MMDTNSQIDRALRMAGAGGLTQQPQRETEVKPGECGNCGGWGEIEAHGEIFGCHECNGTGRVAQ